MAGTPSLGREGAAQRGHGFEIVYRPKLVDAGQHRAHALGARLEGVEAQQRIEPDQAPARAVQPVYFERKALVRVALETVGDQEHDRALGEHAARPALVESVERACDARAT